MDEESNEEIDKEFKQILTTCSFCDVVLDNMESVKKCKLLQCLHSICDNCVQYINSQGNKETYCPKCTLPVTMEKLLDHKILEELIAFEDETNVTCMMHPSESVTHWCNNCLEYICDVCIKLHLQLKATKEHEIIPKMEYLKFNENKQGNFPCKLHPSEQLTLVCTTCKQLTCRDCQLDLHREHGHEFLGTAVVPAKSDILLTYIQLEHHKLLLDEAHKLIKERRNEITQRKQEVHKEINTFSQNLINIIMKWTKNLIGNLDMVTSKQLALYDTQAESVKDLTRPIIHTLKFVKKTLKTSSDTSILYYKDLILNRMQTLNRQKVLIPNSAKQTRVKFTYGNFNNLVRVLQSFGEITVYDEMEDGRTGSDEINDKLTSMLAHHIKQHEEKNENPPNYNRQLVGGGHAQSSAVVPPPDQYGASTALPPAAPAQPPPPQPPPTVVQPPIHHPQSPYTPSNQHLLQQHQPHHQPQNVNPVHHSQPAAYANTVKMSYTEMRMHATTKQIPAPPASYPSLQYPVQHTKPLHQYPWPTARPNMGPTIDHQRISYPTEQPYHQPTILHQRSIIQHQQQQLQQQQQHPHHHHQQQHVQQPPPQPASSCLYQNVQYQPYPPYPRPQIYPNTSRSPAHYPAQPTVYAERQRQIQQPQAPVASWHIPQPRPADSMSTSSGGTAS